VVGGPPRLEPSWSSADGQRVRVGLHAHFANEELVVALSGPVTLRTPDGERLLEPGEVVACPVGRRGAHQLRNRGDQPARALVVSETRTPEVAEHLDSGKVLVLEETGGAEGPSISAFRREDAVDRMADEPGG